MPELITYVHRFLVLMLVVTAVIVLGLMLAYVALLRRKVIEPIEQITAAASSFVETKEPMPESMVARTQDEIETLALTMIQMERDINESMENLAGRCREDPIGYASPYFSAVSKMPTVQHLCYDDTRQRGWRRLLRFLLHR